MPISKGEFVGPYEIVGWIGAGGMGEVYRARDPRLGREVAIKLIPGGMAKDASRVRRFEQEARAAGQLNHPNVLAVYDVGSHAGAPYIISELLDGESLGGRLRSGQLPTRKAVECARQVAEGLAAAHDKHIVHRDVKPENVFITNDGRIKILDFGVAKLTRPSDDVDHRNGVHTETDAGTVVGSAGYMSPEQVRGEALDARSDLFSLGTVLYEMLAGRAPFARRTSAETMTAILNEEPPALAPDVPPILGRIVCRCLEKTRDARFQSARDLAFALDVLSRSEDAATSRPKVAPSLRWISSAGVAALIVLLVGALASWRSRDSAVSGSESLVNAVITPITDWEGTEALAAISPDGRFVAFLSDREGEFDIWLTQVGTGEFRNLTADLPSMNPPGVVLRPFGFSSDGSKIWFSLSGNPGDRKMMMPLLGGKPWAFLGEGDVTPSWSPDGAHLSFVNNRDGDPMFVADGTGGDARQLLAPEPGVRHNHNPVWSADGEWIYFVRGVEPTDQMDIWRLRSAGGIPERLTTLDAPVNFLAALDSRTLLYTSRAADRTGPWLWALDSKTRVSGRVSWGLEHYTSVAASGDGRRVVATVARPTSTLWTAPILDRPAEDRDARRYPVTSVRASAPRFGGQSLFYRSASGQGARLWRFDDGTAIEVWRGSDGTLSEPPSISSDGKRMALLVSRQGKRELTVVSSDGTNAQRVSSAIEPEGAAGQSTSDWLDEGQWLIMGGTDDGGPGLFKLSADGASVVRLSKGAATNPVRSPDGGLVLYTGPFAAGRAPLQAMRPDGTPVRLPAVTVRQGAYRFLPDGTGVVYLPDLQSRDFWLLDLTTGTRRQLTRFTDHRRLETFDITPDGRRIVFDRQDENSDVVLIDVAK